MGGHVPQISELLERLQESIFKGQVREGHCRACDQLMHNSLVDGEVTRQLTLLIVRCPKVWGLSAHDLQVVNFFHLVVVLASERLRKYA